MLLASTKRGLYWENRQSIIQIRARLFFFMGIKFTKCYHGSEKTGGGQTGELVGLNETEKDLGVDLVFCFLFS